MTLAATTKPNPDRVYLIARDAKTGKSKTLTVYNTTPGRIIDYVRGCLDDPKSQSGDIDTRAGVHTGGAEPAEDSPGG